MKENNPVYLTPEEIRAGMLPGIHSTLNEYKVRMTRQDLDTLNALTLEYQEHYRQTIREKNPKEYEEYLMDIGVRF